MFIKLKNLLKKIIPASIFILCREVDRVEEQNKQTQKQLTQMQKQLTQMQMELKRQNKELVDEIRDSRTKSDKQYETLKKVSETSKRYSEEAVWAEIFNNTISNSTWLNDKTFSPGRWAVGYPAIYAIYRILNEVQPKRLLELGLGQSTRIIGQYASEFPDTTHYVIEHDEQWMQFFQRDFPLPSNTTMVQLDREMELFNEATVRTFKEFSERFANQKFDFIVIDAPLGGDMKDYARIDVLRMLPELLDENFVIILDDWNRSGEKNTFIEMEKVLEASEIKYAKGIYRGVKDCAVLVSENLKFVTSM